MTFLNALIECSICCPFLYNWPINMQCPKCLSRCMLYDVGFGLIKMKYLYICILPRTMHFFLLSNKCFWIPLNPQQGFVSHWSNQQLRMPLWIVMGELKQKKIYVCKLNRILFIWVKKTLALIPTNRMWTPWCWTAVESLICVFAHDMNRFGIAFWQRSQHVDWGDRWKKI